MLRPKDCSGKAHKEHPRASSPGHLRPLRHDPGYRSADEHRLQHEPRNGLHPLRHDRSGGARHSAHARRPNRRVRGQRLHCSPTSPLQPITSAISTRQNERRTARRLRRARKLRRPWREIRRSQPQPTAPALPATELSRQQSPRRRLAARAQPEPRPGLEQKPAKDAERAQSQSQLPQPLAKSAAPTQRPGSWRVRRPGRAQLSRESSPS